jgi:hypothetical protein
MIKSSKSLTNATNSVVIEKIVIEMGINIGDFSLSEPNPEMKGNGRYPIKNADVNKAYCTVVILS